MRPPTKTLSVASFLSSWFSARQKFLPQAPEGGRHWINILPPSRPESALIFFAEDLVTFIFLASLNSVVPIRIFRLELYLELLQWVRGILSFRRKDEAKRFPKKYSPLPRTSPPVSQVTRCRNMHSDWIARATAE